MTKDDTINHPKHYTQSRKYEPIKVIDAWRLNFNLGNCIKYIARAPHKGSHLEDLKKARWYLNHEIRRIQAQARIRGGGPRAARQEGHRNPDAAPPSSHEAGRSDSSRGDSDDGGPRAKSGGRQPWPYALQGR